MKAAHVKKVKSRWAHRWWCFLLEAFIPSPCLTQCDIADSIPHAHKQTNHVEAGARHSHGILRYHLRYQSRRLCRTPNSLGVNGLHQGVLGLRPPPPMDGPIGSRKGREPTHPKGFRPFSCATLCERERDEPCDVGGMYRGIISTSSAVDIPTLPISSFLSALHRTRPRKARLRRSAAAARCRG